MSVFPHRFLEKMQDRLGGEYPEFAAALEEQPPVSVRLNPKKGAALFSDETRVPWCRYGRYLEKRPAFVWDPLYHAGAYYAQEASSMALHNLVDFSKDLLVLDLCAAPGGKSSLIHSFLSPGSILVSNELVGKRADILYENLVKWGASNNIVTNNRPADFLGLGLTFDVILIDAPCSGEGMFRKDKGAVSQWSENLVMQCSSVQKEILTVASELLADNGVLVYSTCTFEAVENELNVEWLYSFFKDTFEPVVAEFPPEWGFFPVEIGVENAVTQVGWYCFPHKVRGEGLFFIAFRKKTGHSSRPASRVKNLKPLSLSHKKIVQPYIEGNADTLYSFGNNIYSFPGDAASVMDIFLSRMRVKKAGTMIGALANETLIPSHEMVMDGLAASNIPRIALSLEEALDYMQRKRVSVPSDTPKGWVIFTYEGLDIGWGKNLGSRVNIHYPSNWRIRKEPDWY